MAEKKREPELDLILKHATNFVIKKLDEIADFANDAVTRTASKKSDPAPAPAKSTGAPNEVKTRIERALLAHTPPQPLGHYSTIVCKCGERSNTLGHTTHVRDAIIAELSAPDPVTSWWKNVVDSV